MPPQTSNKNNFQGYAPAPVASASKRRSWPGAVLLVVLFVALVVAALHWQALSDWWRLRSYNPPAKISQLADQDTMTDQARHLFYLNRPQLLSSVDTFRQRCPDSKDNIVLGCYHPVEQGVFVYDVKDAQLQGVAQVTAAHETLHAAYSRLSAKDKTYIDGLLQDYYNSGQVGQRVKDEIALYQKTEPNAVTDEMHSTFGTEIASLPKPLEAYYKRYFSDRSAIVRYQQQYQAEFDSRQAVINKDDQQLAILKQQIDDRENSLADEQRSLQAERSRLDSLMNGDPASYNAAASAYNSHVSAYNSRINQLKSIINQYNQLVVVRNEVAGELTTLDKALDTRLTPQTSNN